MKAVLLQPGHELAVNDVAEPRIESPNDIIVKVTTTSICGSDIHIKYGEIPGIPPGTVIGHEFVGVVDAVGKGVRQVKAGDRVDIPAGIWCGLCAACRRGEIQNCSNGGVWGGGYYFGQPLQGAQASYVRVPNGDLLALPIPENVSDEQAVFVGDIFMTGYHTAYEGRIRVGDTVVVYGCGPIGLCAVVSAQLFGPKQVFAVDSLENRLAVAAQFGATTIHAGHEDPVNRILEITDMQGADVAIEAVGRTESFNQALGSVRRGGMVSVVGLFPESVELQLPILGLYGVRISMGLANPSPMAQLMSLLSAGRVDLSPLCTHTYALADALEAYDLCENHKDQCIKVMLKP